MHTTESHTDGRVIECTSQKMLMSMYVLEYATPVGPFDQGNEPLGSFKDRMFLVLLSD